ncbi:MAG: hypothetical protein PVG32_14360 [Anaerolineales bacterium]
MPQLHLYVSDDLAEKIKHEAQAADMSVSRYIANLVKREVFNDWPEMFFEEVVGGWVGDPLQRPPQGEFERREFLDPELA